MARKPVRAGCATLAFATLIAAGCESSPPLLSDGGSLYTPYAMRKESAGHGGAVDDPVRGEPGANRVRLAPPQDKGQSAAPASPIQPVGALSAAVGEGAVSAAKPSGPSPTPTARLLPAVAVAGGLVSDTVALGPASPPLTLATAIETGLTQNPDLAALRENEGIGAAILGVARTYPFNPIVQTRILPIGRNADGTSISTYNYVFVWQTFELAQQWRYRKEFAAAGLNNTRWTIQQAALQNLALTEQLYFAALYQLGLRDLAERTAHLNDELLAVTERRKKAGRASAADLALVQMDTDSLRQQARLADLAYRNAVLALRRQLNVSGDAPLALDGPLTEYVWHPVNGAELASLTGDCAGFHEAASGDALAAQLAAARPDVFAARANFEAARANLNLARASRVPNVLIGPFYERDTFGTLAIGFQAQMEVPVVNSGKPLVRQREAELRQRQIALDGMEAKARVEARTALDRYEQARLLCEQTRGTAGPQLSGALGKLEEEFRKGEIDIVRIVQARNSVLQYRRTYLDSLNELALAAAALTAATGLPPAALVSPPVGAGVMAPACPAGAPAQLPPAGLSCMPVK